MRVEWNLALNADTISLFKLTVFVVVSDMLFMVLATVVNLKALHGMAKSVSLVQKIVKRANLMEAAPNVRIHLSLSMDYANALVTTISPQTALVS